MRLIGPIGLISLILLGAGCVSESVTDVAEELLVVSRSSEVVFPVENYVEGRWFKTFGEFIDDRFTGYHVADDIEPFDFAQDRSDALEREIPVVSIAKGTVKRVGFVDGYGGLVVVEHEVGGEIVTALYGHLDLGSVTLKAGDTIESGQFIGNLGEDRSEETDGERKHLHFSLHEGASEKINGYEPDEALVLNWINPTDFFNQHGLDATSPGRRVNPDTEQGGDDLRLGFDLPKGLEVEWIPQIEAWSLFTPSGEGSIGKTTEGTDERRISFTPSGEGSSRERSQMLIRFFDASDFLTLSTVTIHATEDLMVGKDDYVARRYDIEKKAGVPDFAFQPDWRNERHIVTDFRGGEGKTRYYVVAVNPEFDREVYEKILSSMEIK